MTIIGLSYNGLKFSMHVRGHAERSGDEDVNLCCAGISMLTASAVELARRYEEKGYLEELTINNISGDVRLKLKAFGKQSEKVVAVYEFLKAGFELLKARYPDKIAWGEI